MNEYCVCVRKGNGDMGIVSEGQGAGDKEWRTKCGGQGVRYW